MAPSNEQSQTLRVPPGLDDGSRSETDQKPPDTIDSSVKEGSRDAEDAEEEKSPSGVDKDTEESKTQDGPEGGFDSTPIPKPPAGVVGYTLKITIHQAIDLAMGDAHVFSSDPFVLAQMNTGLPTRHKEDPNLRFRTQTIHRSTEPEWNAEWFVANVPSSGFVLKLRVYDEDVSDHDDMLGKVHVKVGKIDDDWKGFKLEAFPLKLRDSSKRALAIRGAARMLRFVNHMRGTLYVSIKNLGRTEEDGQNGRLYSVGPCRSIRHYSPVGLITTL
jgi:hypothetical protein